MNPSNDNEIEEIDQLSKDNNSSLASIQEIEGFNYQPFLDELEDINQEFLLRNYSTAWTGCQELIVKLLRLPSPTSSPIQNGFSSKNQPLTLIESWKATYSPKLSAHQEPAAYPDHMVILFHLWINCWSHLITLVGKWGERSSEKSNIKPLVFTESTEPTYSSPDSSFTAKDLDSIQEKIFSMDRTLDSIWGCLIQFYSPELHTIPSDIVLGIMLVAVKQTRFLLAEEIATSWFRTIPEDWKVHLNQVAPSIDWEDEDVEDNFNAKFCQHYDSLMTLYVAHVLVGEGRWTEAPVFVENDEVLPESRKKIILNLVDQAWQEHEAAQIQKQKTLQAHSASAIVAKAKSSPSGNTNFETTNSIQLGQGPEAVVSKKRGGIAGINGSINRLFSYFKLPTDTTSPAATFSGAFAVIFLVVWIIRQNRIKGSTNLVSAFSGSWGSYWLYRIFRSLRPGLPPTSGGNSGL